LRKPIAADADAIFHRYSSDPIVTKYLGWPRHTSVDDTRAFLAFSDAEWKKWQAGPYLIESLEDRRLLGGTGSGQCRFGARAGKMQLRPRGTFGGI